MSWRVPLASEARGLLERAVSLVYDGREHVAGSPGERREAERLLSAAESLLGVQGRLHRVPVLYWRIRCVNVDPEPGFAVSAPYSRGDAEAAWARVPGDPSEERSWRGFPEGRIAVAPMPGDPDDVRAAVLHAWEAGASGLLLESPVPRRMVAVGSWDYSFWAGAPAPIPFAIVDEGYSKRLPPGGRVRVEVCGEPVESWGYTVRVSDGGRGRVGVGAHYDRWFHGFQDDMLGVAQALAAARLLSMGGAGFELLLFTAEEHGAPGPAGWYWAWGSRWYAQQLRLSPAGGEALSVYVNFDLAGREPLMVSGSPQYASRAREALRAAGVEAGSRGWECPECDSMSLALAGVPTISLHTLWAPGVRGYYHTPLDTPERADMRAASAAVAAAVRAALEPPDYSALEAALHYALSPGPLPARAILYEVLAAARRHGWSRVYPELARRHLRPVHVGDYRLDGPAEIEACVFPEACVLRDPRLRGVHTVTVPGWEEVLYHPRGRLWEQARARLAETLWGVREWLREL